ncbi:MAG: NAD-dependent epimerase/dehydratase family protein [Alphaproteobacteria bacterium]|nr:NAD-dependent epimerase/dehydratase family protein [Alphaproteobacteria bacterium]
MKILLTGAAGQFAQVVAQRLSADHLVVGIDVRALPPGRVFPGEFQQVKRYNHRRVAEVFRRHQPRKLIHLGVRGVTARGLSQGYTQNVLGTRHLLAMAERYGVRSVLAMTSFHVYGAHQHNPVNIGEDAPLRASQLFPELVDVVELDHALTTFMWRNRNIATIVLRPCNIIGPSLRNRMTRLLASERCPKLVGFDPMMQFLHEQDAARAVLKAARSGSWGVYNVAGEGAIAWSHAIQLAGGEPLRLPHFVAYPVVGVLSRLRLVFPKHLMDYFRYPAVIDDSAFRLDFDFQPKYSTVETLRSVSGR